MWIPSSCFLMLLLLRSWCSTAVKHSPNNQAHHDKNSHHGQSREGNHHVRAGMVLPPLGVNKTYVINMDSRRDRMRFMSERLYNLSIPYERFAAVNFYHGHYPIADFMVANVLHPDTKMNLTIVREELAQRPNQYFNWGSTGCWQSHLQLYFHIDSVSAHFLPGPFLILEDDADINLHGHQYITAKYLQDVLPSDWEIFLLSHSHMICHNPWGKEYSKVLPADLCHVSRAFTSAAYVIRNHTVIGKMIDYVNTVNSTVIDWSWNTPFLTKELTGYAIRKSPIRQRKTTSNILQDNKATSKKPLIGDTASHSSALP